MSPEDRLAGRHLARTVGAFLDGEMPVNRLRDALAQFGQEMAEAKKTFPGGNYPGWESARNTYLIEEIRRLKSGAVGAGAAVVMRVPGKIPPFEDLFRPVEGGAWREVITNYARALHAAIERALA